MNKGRVGIMVGRKVDAASVMAAVSMAAGDNTERTGRMIASAIGLCLERFGEKSITITAKDLTELSRRFTVEITDAEGDRAFTYRLRRVAPDDAETAELPV